MNYPKFKKGDIVRLVKNTSGFYESASQYISDARLVVGTTYEVTSSIGNAGFGPDTFVYLKGHQYCHAVDCFELVDVKSLDFKNTFGVKGSPYLIEAFKQAALEEGWKLQGPNESTNPDLYFSSTGRASLKKNHFWYSNAGTNMYNLPEQWDEAIACMKERVTIEVANPICIAGYEAEVNMTGNAVAFGCQTFTLQDIKSYIKLYNKETKGVLQIHGETITLKQLRQLEKMLTK